MLLKNQHQSTENKPTVLKYGMPVAANDSASSGVDTITAKGCPFPMDFARVTMSGTTPRKRRTVMIWHNQLTLIYSL